MGRHKKQVEMYVERPSYENNIVMLIVAAGCFIATIHLSNIQTDFIKQHISNYPASPFEIAGSVLMFILFAIGAISFYAALMTTPTKIREPVKVSQ